VVAMEVVEDFLYLISSSSPNNIQVPKELIGLQDNLTTIKLYPEVYILDH